MSAVGIVILLYLFNLISCGVYPNFHSEYDFVRLATKKDWWETASFYQIYPRSFKDTNGDGIGDIKGITEKLPYLKEIGITATWLSPIFESPMVDFGYDISNFYKIQPEYGTMVDFDAMIKVAKAIGIKIILDFVPNHSSDQCEWFKKSVAKDPKYKDYYVWHPGREDPKNPNKRLPPSNWISVFRKSAWEWNEERGEFYLHQFAVQQPDLNYRNPDVHTQMKDVLRFWLDKGVDGFRIDAVPHVYEAKPDENSNYLNEPRNEENNDPEDYGYLIHKYTVDQNETLDLVYEWRKFLDDYKTEKGGETRIILAETYSPINIKMKYYGNGVVEGAQMPFNFFFITDLSKDSDADDVDRLIKEWMTNMPKGRTANWVLGNHDKSRAATRLGEDKVDLFNMILLSLPGASVNYNGEEIGMTDVWISWNDTVDPQACNSNPDIYDKLSRDPERTPFQWNDEKNAGFSDGEKTWLPISPKYKEVNVKRQRGIGRSHLNIYKRLQELRKSETLKEGHLESKVLSNGILVINRYLENNPTYITLANFNNQADKVDLSSLTRVTSKLEYAIINEFSANKIGDIVNANNILLSPKEAVVLRSVESPHLTVDYYSYHTL